MPVVALEGAVKQYGEAGAVVRALDEVTLAVEPGEFVSLVGRSGCGKTTLLNLCGAMDFADSGRVLLDGADTARISDAELTLLRREKVGFVFQFFHLLPTLTVAENVELPLQLAGRREVRGAALERLRLVEMESYADRLPYQLSGGQMQRAAIARAVVHSPILLLADEPIGNLDGASAEVVMGLLRRIADETATAVVMATHSQEAAQVADTLVRLRDGRVEERLCLRSARGGSHEVDASG